MTETIFIFRSSIKPESRFWEGVRMSAAFVGMDHVPLLIFMDDSVLALKKDVIKSETYWEYLKTSADLAGLYVFEESLSQFKISLNELDPDFNVQLLTLDKITKEISKAKVITTF